MQLTFFALLFALPAFADLYTKKSPVVQVTAKTYDKLIAQSNQSAVSGIFFLINTHKYKTNKVHFRSLNSMRHGAVTAKI